MYRRILVLAFVVLVLTTNYLYIVIPFCMAQRAGCLGYPVAVAALPMAPGAYRPLWPAIETALAPAIPQSEPPILFVDLLIMVVCISVTIPALYLWLKQWTEPDRAVFGVVIFGFLYLSAYHFFFRGGGIPIEAACVALSLALIKRSWLWIVPFVVIGAFNRETSLVIPFIYGAYHWRDKWGGTAALLAIWALITVGIHLAVGPVEHSVGGFIGTLQYNIGTLSSGLVSNLIFVPIVLIVAMAYRTTPPILKRLTWVALIYLSAVVSYGAWEESQRLVLPLLIVVMPLLLLPRYRIPGDATA